MEIALQISSAFLALLGGLLISSDFLGSERLDRIEGVVRSNLKQLAFRRWDHYTSMVGYSMFYWGRIGFVSLLLLVLAFVTFHTFLVPLSLTTIAICCAIFFIAPFFICRAFPAVGFFLALPAMGLLFMLTTSAEIIFVVPVLGVHDLAERYKLPYLVKLFGAICAIIGFLLFLVYLFSA